MDQVVAAALKAAERVIARLGGGQVRA